MRGKRNTCEPVFAFLRITPACAGKTSCFPRTPRPGRDHPRACGENSDYEYGTDPDIGSPPRMRGKRFHRGRLFVDFRITPAHAGKTRPPHPRGKCSADHPRACGENLLCLLYAVEPSGSPPRMRGKRGLLRCCAVSPRITPAHAGKTGYIQTLLPCGADHPRACGENLVGHRGMVAKSGSPPRMRGKRPPPEQLRQQTRITPAHAGKTRADSVILCLHPDHPRACGENEEPQIPQLPNVGSPPRMRGKQPPKQDTARASRITPAHAGKTCPPLCYIYSIADHPRACGENRGSLTTEYGLDGSPPRMRGKLTVAAWPRSITRITPAHAGKTASARLFSAAATDHPRACGENRSVVKPPCFTPGSPPRMRGKRAAAAVRLVGERITPAHAGKTLLTQTFLPDTTDHPRACGENADGRHVAPTSCGSPPRMRGKQPPKQDTARASRITPAHAGKTCPPLCYIYSIADHPRACGENRGSLTTEYGLDGSPPRMRGKLTVAAWPRSITRITPAHAGKTASARLFSAAATDHPRACGENRSVVKPPCFTPGSPPRMRGKRAAAAVRLVGERITPAHAGKTLLTQTFLPDTTDHPRACGENADGRHVAPTSCGSPPRMRGKLQCASQRNPASRITPAHAGKTSSSFVCLPSSTDHPRACGENLFGR